MVFREEAIEVRVPCELVGDLHLGRRGPDRNANIEALPDDGKQKRTARIRHAGDRQITDLERYAS